MNTKKVRLDRLLMKRIAKISFKVILSVIVITLIYLTIIKGHTLPILSKNSIAEYETVKLGEAAQSILIRGSNIKNTVLLYLHGGPGDPETSFITKYQSEWEKYFTVVNWDQRGAGKSYDSKIDINTIPEVHIPIYFCQGIHDNQTSYKLAKNYYEQIKAPQKRFETFYNSAHFPMVEESKKFSDYLINTVLPETYK